MDPENKIQLKMPMLYNIDTFLHPRLTQFPKPHLAITPEAVDHLLKIVSFCAVWFICLSQ